MHIRRSLAIAGLSFFAAFALAFISSAQTACPLQANKPFRANNSKSVYYITADCKKRPIKNPTVYFSYFTTWNEVGVVPPSVIAGIAPHPLNFLPWGPRRTFQNGTLMKSTEDPRVYLLLNETLYPFGSESAFLGLGYSWKWIEDVDNAVISRYSKQPLINSAEQTPTSLVFKYADSPRVYAVAIEDDAPVKQYIDSYDYLIQVYRPDRIATFPASRQLPDPKVPNTRPIAVAPSTSTDSTGTRPTPAPVNPVNPTAPGGAGSGTRPTTPPQVTPTNPTTPTTPPPVNPTPTPTPSDTTAPVVSGVLVSGITSSSATITWTTNEAASSVLSYGTSTAYGSTSADTARETGHARTLTGLTAGTTYSYRACSVDAAGNQGCSTNATFTVTVIADTTAPTLRDVAVSAITSSGATITWTTNEAATSTVQYGLTTVYGLNSADSVLETAHSRSLTALTSNSLYHYRVCSTDSANNQACSPDGTFTVTPPPDTTAPTITAAQATAITTTGATISWITNEAATSVVQYGTTTAYGLNSTDTVLATSHTRVLAGLTPGTFYNYRVCSTDAANNQACSNNGSFTAVAPPVVDTAAPIVTAVLVSGITQSGATITWATNENATSVVQYGLTSAYGSTSASTVLEATHARTLTGLEATTTYNYRVCSTDAAGNQGCSSNATFATANIPDTTAPTVSAVASGAITTTGATITWTTNEAATSVVQYGTTTAYGLNSTDTSMVTSHSRALTGLTAGTTYNYRVCSTDTAANQACSGNATFTMTPPPDTTPPVISAAQASGITQTGATITWTTNEAATSVVQYGTTTAYGLNSSATALVTSHSRALSGLTAGTLYNYRICSTDAANNQVCSTNGSFTTMSNTPPPDTTPPVISAAQATNITSTGATISWTTNEASTTVVQYGTTTAYGLNSTDTTLVTSHTRTLTGLTAGTFYNYRVCSTDAANNQVCSTNGSFTATPVTPPADTTPPVVSAVASGSITATGATITWTTNEASTTVVQYGTTTSYGTTSTDAALLTSHSRALTGLSASTIYNYRVCSTDAANNQTCSSNATFTTTAATTPPPTGNVSSTNSPIGMNIQPVRYYSREWPFANLMRTGRPWFVQNGATYDTGEQNTAGYMAQYLDSNGWPRTLPTGRSFNTIIGGAPGQLPTGTYHVYYDGQGTITYDGVAANAIVRATGHDTLTFTSAPSFTLRITATDPSGTGNYIRNVRVMMPNTTDGQFLNSRFVQDVGRYRTIRYMQFADINTSRETTWSTRTKYEYPQWNTVQGTLAGGAPPEAAIDMSIALGADAWLTMPTQATDDYIQGYAAMARDRLVGTGLKVYVEYSNEIWNDAFPYNLNGQWVEAQGQLSFPNSGQTGFVVKANQFAKRSTQICAIWKAAWGANASNVKCVMGGWTGNGNNWNTLTLNCSLYAAQRSGRNCAADMDALATAPYFGAYIGNDIFLQRVLGWTSDPDGGLNKLFQEIETGGLLYTAGQTSYPRAPQDGALAAAFRNMDTDVANARTYNLPLIAYEGGEHLVGVGGSAPTNQTLLNLFSAANRDPRMGTIIDRYLAGWFSRGGQLFTYFQSVAPYGQYGNSATKEYQDQTTAPKYNAIQNFIINNPCAWAGCVSTAVPGTPGTPPPNPPPTNDTTPPTVSAVAVSAITTTSATISWTTNEASTSVVQYGTTTSYGLTSNDTALLSSHSRALTGLTTNTLYHYRVCSVDAAGNQACSIDATFTASGTADITAPSVSAVASSALTAAGATISWTTNEASTSVVQYGTTTAYGLTSTDTALLTSHSRALTGLTASTTYNYRVCSTDAANNQACSTNATFATTAVSGGPLTDPVTGAWRPFSTTSPWNTPISANPTLDPNSAIRVAEFASSSSIYAWGGPWADVAIHQWSIPVFFADAATPRVSVTARAGGLGYGGSNTTATVPMPADAAPDGQTDGSMVVVDRSTSLEWDFWQASRNADGTWGCSTCANIDITGTGVRPGSQENQGSTWWRAHGSRACGFPLAAGLIRPEEIRAGRIGHALAMAYSGIRAGWYVSPASTGHPFRADSTGTTADGDDEVNRTTGIPCGSRLQLDPNLNLDTLGLSAGARVIARALQEYGAYVGDYSAGINLYADNSPSALAEWDSGLLTESALHAIDANRFRLLDAGTLADGFAGCQPGTTINTTTHLCVSTGGGDTTPPTVSAVASSAITSTSATVTWTTNESSSSLVQYGTSTTYTANSDDPTRVTSHTRALVGLTAGTTYNYRACSTDAGGNQGCSGNLTFTTSGGTPPPADTTPPTISATASSAITSSGATITWTTNEASTSVVQYGTTTSYGTTSTDTALLTSHSRALTGLTASTTYNYRVCSTDAANNQACGGNATFTTSAGTTPPPTGTRTSATAYFIGHSHVNLVMPKQLQDIARSLGMTFSYASQVNNGTSLQGNWNNTGAPNQNTRYQDELPRGVYDVVVMTEATPFYGVDQAYRNTELYAGNFYDMAIQYNPSAQVYFYETWHCRTSGNPSCDVAGGATDAEDDMLWRPRITRDVPKWEGVPNRINSTRSSGPDMQILRAGEALGRLVDAINAGVVPNITSWDQIFQDNVHVNDIGNYYVALVHYATIFGRSPYGATYNTTNIWNGALTPPPSLAAAQCMQAIAWESVSGIPRTVCTSSAGGQQAAAPSSPSDTTPPTVSAVATSNLSSTGVTVTWTTNEASTTVLQYGTSTAYGTTSTDTAMATSHSRTITGLTANTLYHYRVCSTDAAGNQACSIDATFTTSVAGGGGAITLTRVGTTNQFQWTSTGNLGNPDGFEFLFSRQAVAPTYPAATGTTAWFRAWSLGSPWSAWPSAFDGAGTYHLRVCAYHANGTCDNYSNQIDGSL